MHQFYWIFRRKHEKGEKNIDIERLNDDDDEIEEDFE